MRASRLWVAAMMLPVAAACGGEGGKGVGGVDGDSADMVVASCIEPDELPATSVASASADSSMGPGVDTASMRGRKQGMDTAAGGGRIALDDHSGGCA